MARNMILLLCLATALVLHTTTGQGPPFSGTAESFGTPHLHAVLIDILTNLTANHDDTLEMMETQHETLNSVKETQAQTVIILGQIIGIMTLNNEQVGGLSKSFDNAVNLLESQKDSLDNLTQTLPFVLQQQAKSMALMERQLAVSMNKSVIGAMPNNPSDVMQGAVSDMMYNLTCALNQQTEIETQILLLQHGPRDCSNVASRDVNFCHPKTNGNGWTVIQRRYDGSISFYRGWEDYEYGFGSPDHEFWAGLEKLHEMTQSGHWVLRIDLESFDRAFGYAEYDGFKVGNEATNYTLTLGSYNGTAGDSLGKHNNTQFTSYDRDNDNWGHNCAEYQKSAWWHREDCGYSNLNGMYGKSSTGQGMWWYDFKKIKSLRKSSMKIKRVN